ncbi:MAG: hypothetical protein JSS41_07325, partial [Proteobacteria bacterium]|nr:hypothetical protein [Pseudomonadota bacterium]
MPQTSRLLGFLACLVLLAASCAGLWWSTQWLWGVGVFGALVLVGLYDLLQRQHA